MDVRLGILASHPIQYQAPLYRRLAAQAGVDVEVLFVGDHGVAPSFDPGFGRMVQFDVPLTEGYRHRFLKTGPPSRFAGYQGGAYAEVVRAIRQGKYDVLMIHGYATAASMMALATPRGGQTRLLMRGESHLHVARGPFTIAAKALLMPSIFRRVDHFLAIGSWNAEYYQHYGVSRDRITLAPYSVDTEFFEARAANAKSDRTAVRRRYGIGETATVFLYCSKLTPRKRPLDLIRAFSEARKSCRCELVIVGDGPESEIVRQESRRLGYGVHLLGFRNQTELPGIYAMCDAFVLPSEAEPWGLVVNEAMSCGLAVAVSDAVGAGPDLVHGIGEIFPCGDVPALARILERWASDPEKLEANRSLARQRISTWGLKATVEGVLAGMEKSMSGRVR